MNGIIGELKNLLAVHISEKERNDYTGDEHRRIEIVNYLSLLSAFNMLLYIIIYSFIDIKLFFPAIVFLSISIIGTVGIIVINKKGFYNAAKIAIAIVIPFSMTYVSLVIFGKAPGFHVYLLLATVFPVFMWPFKEKLYLILFISLYLVLYSVLEFFPPIFEAQILIPGNYISIFKSTNMIVCFLALAFAIGIYQRLINIKEKQLIQQTKELILSQAHKDLVYSIIGHDLRGPIGSLVGLTDYYVNNSEKHSDKVRKDIITNINETSVSLHNLLENLLDWSKLQSGNLNINKSTFLTETVIEEAIKLYHDSIKEKNISVLVNTENHTKITSDFYMVSTIFRNLLSNAIKFTPLEGEILISASQINGELVYCVSDNGIGMDKDIQENLFKIEKFNNSVKNNLQKGGLGLLICKDFVERLEGKIWVESEIGKGSSFYFTVN